MLNRYVFYFLYELIFVWGWAMSALICMSVIRRVTNTPTEQTIQYAIWFHVLSIDCYFFFACLCEWNASNKMLSLSCLKEIKVCYYCGWVVCVWHFFALFSTVHEYECLGYVLFADASCFFTLLLIRLLLCFSIIMKKWFVTLLLFLAAFSTANRKIQKGKVQQFY